MTLSVPAIAAAVLAAGTVMSLTVWAARLLYVMVTLMG